MTVPETVRLIESGAVLTLAGSPQALGSLPPGNWIGGTSHYFVGPAGGVKANDMIFVTQLDRVGHASLAYHGPEALDRIICEAPENGFTFIILPAGSKALRAFAQRDYSADLFLKPSIGWVAGVDLSAPAPVAAAVYFGPDRNAHTDGAVIAQVTLPADRLASISIIDPFQPRPEPVLRFETSGFSATHCIVDGQPTPLTEVLTAHRYTDGRLPLIGDFSSAKVNVSIQSICPKSGRVDFYAPVFAGVDYRLAQPLQDFASGFGHLLSQHQSGRIEFSCNCILNFMHGQLEGKQTGTLTGPVTFGEIGYQLLNQTVVMLEIA